MAPGQTQGGRLPPSRKQAAKNADLSDHQRKTALRVASVQTGRAARGGPGEVGRFAGLVARLYSRDAGLRSWRTKEAI